MSDSFSLTAIGAAALSPTFDFLYGHLNRLLDRRHGTDDTDPATGEATDDATGIDVPECVAEDPGPFHAAPERIDQYGSELERLAGALSSYARHPDRLREGDERLARELGALREVLEGVYGRRITFVGEERDASGIHADLDLENVWGETVGVKIVGVQGPIQGPVTSKMSVRGSGPGSKSTGVEYDAG